MTTATFDLEPWRELICTSHKTPGDQLKEGMIKVPRDALGRMFCDHSKVLANIRSDSVIDVEEPGPVVGNLLNVMVWSG